jgi:hypothetical protein
MPQPGYREYEIVVTKADGKEETVVIEAMNFSHLKEQAEKKYGKGNVRYPDQ